MRKYILIVVATVLLSSYAGAFDLDGKWVSIVEGPMATQEVMMEIDGNTYSIVMNNNIVESGSLKIKGQKMEGVSNNSGKYVYDFKPAKDGDSFVLTMPNGYSTEYRRR